MIVRHVDRTGRFGHQLPRTVGTREANLLLAVLVIRSMHFFHMAVNVLLPDKSLITLITSERMLSGVVHHVLSERGLVLEQLGANRTFESNRNIRMFEGKVYSHGLHRRELPFTLGTREVTLTTFPYRRQLRR